MPSFKIAAVFVATAILAFGAQGQVQYVIDPNSVPLSTRENWCTSQKASCPLLCLQLEGSASSTLDNTCNATTLVYQCTCGNGQAPNAANYSQTIPYFECTEYGNQCVAACPAHDSACQTACRVNNPCGAQDPTLATNTTSGSSSTTASSSGSTGTSASSTGSGSTGTGGSSPSSASNTGSAASPTTTNGAQSALDLARSYSFAVLFAVLFGVFALGI